MRLATPSTAPSIMTINRRTSHFSMEELPIVLKLANGRRVGLLPSRKFEVFPSCKQATREEAGG